MTFKIRQKIISVLIAAAVTLSVPFTINAENESIDDIMAAMTTEQKVAQMIMPAVRYYEDESGSRQNMTELKGKIKDLIDKYPFTGVILYAMNITGTEQTAPYR